MDELLAWISEDVGEVARFEARLGDRLGDLEARLSARLDALELLGDRLGMLAADIVERLDAILETVGEIEGAEARRRLALTPTCAVDGNVCRTCGFVAVSASGLATPQPRERRVSRASRTAG